MTMPLLGIALGGGGVRGAAHVGVLQEIDSAGIKIDRIAGAVSYTHLTLPTTSSV